MDMYQRKLKLQSNRNILSTEKIYIVFIIECLSNHVKVILEKEYRFNTKAFKDKFIKINFRI